MKTEPQKKYNFTDSPHNEQMKIYLFNRLDSEKETAFKKIKSLVNENMLLKQQLENQNNHALELIDHNRNIVSIIAHDLRSPYQSLLGIIEFLIKNSSGMNNEILVNYLRILENSTNTSLSMLDNLLDWAIFDNNRRTYNPCRINLYQTVESVILSINTIAEYKKIQLKNEIPNDVDVVADYNMLQIVLRNLIMNGIQFNYEGGMVQMNYKLKDNYHEIEISDDGFGINEEDIQKLLSARTIDETISMYEDKWKGLGLHFCKEFIEKHGGKILIEKRKQQGTSVRFTIPI
ncbi:MAG: sensor histidine kinase [Omnitrophica WOR_2 bacterium]|jgi:signal transduction histidine kinase